MFDLQILEQIDLIEYTGLHTSVYLLSLFTKPKAKGETSIPVGTYQSLVKKLKQLQMQVQNKQ